MMAEGHRHGLPPTRNGKDHGVKHGAGAIRKTLGHQLSLWKVIRGDTHHVVHFACQTALLKILPLQEHARNH